jgi:hypothetical protein
VHNTGKVLNVDKSYKVFSKDISKEVVEEYSIANSVKILHSSHDKENHIFFLIADLSYTNGNKMLNIIGNILTEQGYVEYLGYISIPYSEDELNLLYSACYWKDQSITPRIYEIPPSS